MEFLMNLKIKKEARAKRLAERFGDMQAEANEQENENSANISLKREEEGDLSVKKEC